MFNSLKQSLYTHSHIKPEYIYIYKIDVIYNYFMINKHLVEIWEMS